MDKTMNMFGGSDFDYEVIENVIVIYDLDHGGRSVTNNIQAVLDIVSSEVSLHGKKIIYRDSQKVFDGINHYKGAFQSFYSVNETVLEKALTKVNQDISIH